MGHAAPQRPPVSPLVSPGGHELFAADMTATFSADLTLAAARRELERVDQWLPIDGNGDASLGSLVIRNSTGPLRLGYGAWRDLLLGIQLRDGTGELITAGGRVVKNVAGYDLTKFAVGSFGCFGTPLTLTTRTYKRPAGAIHVNVDLDSINITELLVTDLRPSYVLVWTGGTLLGYVGDSTALNFYQPRLEAKFKGQVARESIEADIELRERYWSRHHSLRISLPPAKWKAFVAAAKLHDFAADPVHGVIVSSDDIDPKSILSLAAQFDASVTAFDSAGGVIASNLRDGEREIALRIKARFDPEGKLPALP